MALSDADKRAILDAFTTALGMPSTTTSSTTTSSTTTSRSTTTPPSTSTTVTSPVVPTPTVDPVVDPDTYTESFAKGKLLANEITGILGVGANSLTEVAKAQANMVDGLRKTFQDVRPEIADFRDILGGISAAAVSGEEALTGVGKSAIEGYENIIRLASGAENAIDGIELKSDYLAGENVFALLFEDAEDAAIKFSNLLLTTEEAMPGMFRNMTMEMQRDTVAFQQALKLSDEEVTTLMKQQFAFTGEASNKIFEDISNVSVALSKETGIAQQSLQADIVAIKQDVANFGDIGVDAAGRIAASLGKLGLDFQTFTAMTDKFMNFDDAATKMGELSALFGIQMDAMEMTYLANEDREEFLLRMREQVLDAGLDVENMSNARARVLSQQMGMNVEQMKIFLREGEDALDQSSLEAATDQADTMDGMTTAVESIGRVEGVRRTDTDAITKNMQLQKTYAEGMRKEIGQAQASTALMAGDFLKIKLPQEAIDMAVQGQKLFNEQMVNFEQNILSKEIELVNSGLLALAKTFHDNSELLSGQTLKAEFDPGGDQDISSITAKLQQEIVTELTSQNTDLKTEVAQATTAAIQNAEANNAQKYDEIISYVKNNQVVVEMKLDDVLVGSAMINILKDAKSSTGETILMESERG